MKPIHILLIASILVVGCSKSDVSGDVYVIKGNGSVIPSAGRTVRLVNAENRADLFEQAKSEAMQTTNIFIGNKIASHCPIVKSEGEKALDDLSSELKSIKSKGTIPEGGCEDLWSEGRNLKSQFESKINELYIEKNMLQSSLQSAKNNMQSKLVKEANNTVNVEIDEQNIRTIQENLNSIDNIIVSKELLSEHHIYFESAIACKNDIQLVNDLNASIERGMSNISLIQDCYQSSDNSILSSLEVVNSEFNLGIELPNDSKHFQSEFAIGVKKAILSLSAFSTETTINGSFMFNNVPKGRYLIFTDYHDNFVDGFWLDSVTIDSDSPIINLNMKTFINIDFTEYLIDFASQSYNKYPSIESRRKSTKESDS